MVKTEGVFNPRSTEVAICEQFIYQPERKREARDSIHIHPKLITSVDARHLGASLSKQ